VTTTLFGFDGPWHGFAPTAHVTGGGVGLLELPPELQSLDEELPSSMSPNAARAARLVRSAIRGDLLMQAPIVDLPWLVGK
jgi:hypothetical protein